MRGLSIKFINDLKVSILRPFLDSVLNDDTLSLEIRYNYVNIYYRGGNLFRINPNANDYEVSFDMKYCLPGSLYGAAIKQITSSDYGKWIANIPFIKAEMDAWFHKHPKLEREFQQLILRENNNSNIASDTDYYIVDIEYANSENKSRFDMIGVKWLSTSSSHKKADDLRLVFIENKNGDSALSGKSGIQKHFDDLYTFMCDKQKVDTIYQEAENIFRQKIELGLIPKLNNKNLCISKNKPEFILLIANHKPAKTVLAREIAAAKSTSHFQTLKGLVDLKVAKASYMGYGLYSELMDDIN